jgi:hypothetical protein
MNFYYPSPDRPTLISLLKRLLVKIGVKNRKGANGRGSVSILATMMGPSSLFMYGIKASMTKGKI